MKTKICSKCNSEKSLCEFYTDKSKIDGFYSSCKECKNLYGKTKIDEKKVYLKQWRLKNPNYMKDFRKKNPNYAKDYYKKNKKVLTKRVKKHYLDNKEKNIEKYKLKAKKYYIKNKEGRLKYAKIYRQNNRKKINEYVKKKKSNDPIYRLSTVVRNRIKNFLKQKKITKKNNTFTIVGCTPEILKQHLENSFIEGMSWENHGLFGWHIDHIIPLSSAKTEEEILKLCHYTNLQPLWAKNNLEKGNKTLY